MTFTTYTSVNQPHNRKDEQLMLFSIVVPVYNVESYLNRCMASLIKQTYQNIEIILVDDGSTDRSSEMCDNYAAQDSRIHVIHKKNGGLSDARNKGMDIATGEYILFVDSDDYIDVDACQNLCNYAVHGYDILIADAIIENGNKDLSHISKTGAVWNGIEYLLLAHQEKKAPMAVWLNAYRRTFLIENNLSFKFGILHEDEEFTPRAFLKAHSVIYTNLKFYHYVIRENSICTKSDKRRNAQDIYTTCCELEVLYNKINHPKLKIYLLDSLTRMYLNIFQVGKLYQYGKEFLHKDLVYRNAKLSKTRLKAALYILSPRLYYFTNKTCKKGFHHV